MPDPRAQLWRAQQSPRSGVAAQRRTRDCWVPQPDAQHGMTAQVKGSRI